MMHDRAVIFLCYSLRSAVFGYKGKRGLLVIGQILGGSALNAELLPLGGKLSLPALTAAAAISLERLDKSILKGDNFFLIYHADYRKDYRCKLDYRFYYIGV